MENKRLHILIKFFKIISLYLGVCSALLCTALRLDLVFHEKIFLVVLFFFLFVSYGIFSILREMPYGTSMAVGAFGILFILFLIRFRGIILKGSVVIINSFLKLVMSYYNMKMELLSYPEGMSEYGNSYCTTVVLCLLGLCLLAIVSLSFQWKKGIYFYLGATLPLILLPIFVGRFAFYKEMLFYILSLTMLIGFRMNRDDTGAVSIQAKVTGFIAGGVLLSAGIAFLLCTPHEYERHYEKLIQIKQEVSSLSEWSSNETFDWFRSQFSADALDYGKIGTKDRIDYTGRTILIIYPTKADGGSIFLKGFVGDIYKNNEWVLQDDLEWQQAKQATESHLGTDMESWGTYIASSLSVSGEEEEKQYAELDRMRIRNVAMGSKNKVSPYYRTKTIVYDADGRVALDGGSQYYLSYYYRMMSWYRDVILQNLPISVYDTYYIAFSSVNQKANMLNRLAKESYCALPEGMDTILADFQKWCKKRGIGKRSAKRKIIRSVAKYLIQESGLQYTLAPGKTPEGKDSIDYFLNENKKGYCIHFASSAVMMLRSLGVPARYAEGVYVSPEKVNEYLDGKTDRIELEDRNAHAWVEVYDRECGFIPFDFTPGTADSALLVSSKPSLGGLSNQNPTPSPTQGSVQQSQEPEEDMEFEDIENAKKKKEPEKAGVEKGYQIPFVVKIVLAVLLFIILVHLQYMVRKRIYLKHLRKEGKRGKIQILYRHIRPLLQSAECEYRGTSQDELTNRLLERIQAEPEQIKPFACCLLKSQYAKEIEQEDLIKFENSYHLIHASLWKELAWYEKLLMRYVFIL